MSEYEKAMLLLSMQQSEYLHIIAADRNSAKAGPVAKRTFDMIHDECPSVADFLANCAKRHNS